MTVYEDVSVYPYPTIDEISVGQDAQSYKLIDRTGRVLKMGTVAKADVDLGDQPLDLYFIKVVTRSGVGFTERILFL